MSRPVRFPPTIVALASIVSVAVVPSPAAPPATSPVAPLPETGVESRGPVSFAGMRLVIRTGRLVVSDVAAASPAADAGVLAGDVVLAVNDIPLVDLDAITPARALDLFRRSAGETIRLILGRGGASLRVSLPVDAAPSDPPVDPTPLLPGRPAPPIDGADLAGARFSLRSLAGRPILIDFWASTCPPCGRTPIPLRRIADQYAGDLEVVGVSLDQDPRTFEAFVRNHQLPGHQIRDGGGWFGPIARRYGIASTGIPYFVLVDGDGRVVTSATTLPELEGRIADLVTKARRGAPGGRRPAPASAEGGGGRSAPPP